MVYYTESNAEIHLRAVVEDVLPSVTVKLQEIIDLALQQVVPVRKALGLKGEGWVAERYGSLPYLLVRAYGGCYLWTVLSEVLHRRPLSGRRFAAGAASRMNGLAKESLWDPVKPPADRPGMICGKRYISMPCSENFCLIIAEKS